MEQRVSDELLAEMYRLPLGQEVLHVISDLQDARREITRLENENERMHDPDYWASDQSTRSPFRNERKVKSTIRLSNHSAQKGSR